MLITSSLRRRILSAVALLSLATGLVAQTPEREYSLKDETVEGLQKYKTATEAKDNNAALAVLDGLLPKVPADSFDAAYLLVQKAQVYVQLGDYSKALEPMAKGIQLSDSKTPTFFDERQTREIYFFLFQLYFQEANNTKNSTLVAGFYDKAQQSIEKWLKLTPESSADAQMMFAQLLISRAMLIQDKPDKALLERALKEIDRGLLLATRPKDTFYLLKLICMQQLDRNEESAALMEFLLTLKPDNGTYWQQLAGLYVGLGQDLRAILTIERAQAHGFMNTPKDNFNLIAIYSNSQQFEKSAELLEKHLKAGTIENDPKNWELLAGAYQQMQRPIKGIEALKEGTKAFPKSGQLEFQIAQAYMSLDKPEEALPHVQSAIAKGGLNKPHQVYLFLAYTGYQLKKFDIALEAARKAASYPEGAKEAANMVKALEDLMKDREAKKNKA